MKTELVKAIEALGINWTVLDKLENGYLVIGNSIERKKVW